MSSTLPRLSRRLFSRPFTFAGSARKRVCRPYVRPVLEGLEERVMPANTTITVTSTADTTNFPPTTVTLADVTNPPPKTQVTLLDAINAANNDALVNPTDVITIDLAANATYTLNKIDPLNSQPSNNQNVWYGPNGLPPIASDIIINGDGSTIARETLPASPTSPPSRTSACSMCRAVSATITARCRRAV